MDFRFLKTIREYELSQVIKYLPPHCTLVELGAGAGWQAAQLSSLGHTVIAYDIQNSEYEGERVREVLTYDGSHIPLADRSVDIVFSSNVLEHVQDLKTLLSEIQRVLKPGGKGIHSMPTPSWRFWSMCSHHLGIIKEIGQRLMMRISGKNNDARSLSASHKKSSRRLLHRILRMIIPPRHGEHGTLLSELSRFSQTSWEQEFQKAGFTLITCEPCGLWYSGNHLLGRFLPLSLRRRLSKVLGSSCNTYVVSVPTYKE